MAATADIPSASTIVGVIRDEPGLSRAALAAQTGLSKAVVSERVRWLIDLGLVDEIGENESTGGRRGTRLSLSHGIGTVAAVEIAMTHVRVSVMNLARVRLWSERLDVSMRQGPQVVLDALEGALERGISEAGQGPLCGVGVGIAGPVEFETGRTIHPPVHPDWHDQPVKDRLQVRFGVPVRVDNEVNLMALAEHAMGSASTVNDALVIKVGSWVGAGLISNGKLHRGAQGAAGSLVTSAGGDDIAEQAELLALTDRSSGLTKARTLGHPITAQLVAELAQFGDAACQELLDHAAENVGKVLSVVVDFFNPDVLVVSGGVTSGGDSFLARVREVIYGNSLALATRDLRIVRSELEESATLGAAIMIIEEVTNPDNLDRTIDLLGRSMEMVEQS